MDGVRYDISVRLTVRTDRKAETVGFSGEPRIRFPVISVFPLSKTGRITTSTGVLSLTASFDHTMISTTGKP